MTKQDFKKLIWNYYRKHGRHDMPWRKTRDPYNILVSEVMLQQTQVARVIGYYEKFIKRFPNIKALAKADTRSILRMWQGLGYNRRALNLQKLSRIVLENFNGKLPREREELESLPGIGPGTAGALRAFAFNEPEVFIETNIRRVFIHFFFPTQKNHNKKSKKVTDEALTRYIKGTLTEKNPREWYYALMDYGAMLGVVDREGNANRRSAHYKPQSRFTGSRRELRGKILRIVLTDKTFPKRAALPTLAQRVGSTKEKVQSVLNELVREGFFASAFK